ncbi:hypothetical protein [Shewanella sp.]|uniref:hypothetical protein n=1 Tax=Shewanella sp. TaxID=50422 RepID=UPI0040540BD4
MGFNFDELKLKLKAMPPLLALSYCSLFGLMGLVLLPLVLPLALIAALIAAIGLRRFSRHYLPPKAGQSYPKIPQKNIYKSQPNIEILPKIPSTTQR